MPADAKRRGDDVEAATYSTEGGLSQEAPSEDRKRRRPRRKRRPRPEVIATLRTPGEEDGDGEVAAEES
jgi:hypothetical protein